jgi:antitoxin component HigA of HigAB toxin-antitoxin module
LRDPVADANRPSTSARNEIEAVATRRLRPVDPGAIDNERHYRALVAFMNELLDKVGDRETHPLVGLLDMVTVFVRDYEERNVEMPDAAPATTIMEADTDRRANMTAVQYRAALRAIEGLMSANARTQDGDRLDALAAMVEWYESTHPSVFLLSEADVAKVRGTTAGKAKLREHEQKASHVSELPANVIDELGGVAIPETAATFNHEYRKK